MFGSFVGLHGLGREGLGVLALGGFAEYGFGVGGGYGCGLHEFPVGMM